MSTPKLSQILWIDIETVSIESSFIKLDTEWQRHWEHKMRFDLAQNPETNPEQLYKDRAAIFAEFGKIICISIGVFLETSNEFAVKSFWGDDEYTVLAEFKEFLEKNERKKKFYTFCGHNIREFDIPYICRRMLVNGLNLPIHLQIQSKKPWEVNLIDTLQLWKFGDYKYFVSLDLLASLFKIPSPKQDIDGSKVGEAYWESQSLKKIVEYCQRDVIAVFQLYRKMNQLDLFPAENINVF